MDPTSREPWCHVRELGLWRFLFLHGVMGFGSSFAAAVLICLEWIHMLRGWAGHPITLVCVISWAGGVACRVSE